MPRDVKREQYVLEQRAGTNIVNDEGSPILRLFRYQADVGCTGGEAPGHDVAGVVGFSTAGYRQGLGVSAEKCSKVRNATMVDIGIRPGEPPEVGVEAEITRHVVVYEDLKVKARVSIGPNDDVGANTSLEWHIAARKRNGPVTPVVEGGRADLSVGALQDEGHPG
jgi:hypothetical protein